MSELTIVDLLRISNPFIAKRFRIVPLDRRPAKSPCPGHEVRECCATAHGRCCSRVRDATVEKLNLLFARERFDVLVVDVLCAGRHGEFEINFNTRLVKRRALVASDLGVS